MDVEPEDRTAAGIVGCGQSCKIRRYHNPTAGLVKPDNAMESRMLVTSPDMGDGMGLFCQNRGEPVGIFLHGLYLISVGILSVYAESGTMIKNSVFSAQKKNSTVLRIHSSVRLLKKHGKYGILHTELQNMEDTYMHLIIGERIRQFRREKNLTQEEVAAHLGISFQAVSKWERCDGYPDITLLPALANYFGVTTDRLIGMDEIASGERLQEIHRQWLDNRNHGRHRENVVLMREALQAYPNDALLLVQLSASLERLDGSAAEKREYLRESIDVQEQIIRYCEDSEVRSAVLRNIADSYYRYGNMEKAMEYADKLPNLYKTRESAMVQILEGKEKHSAAEDALIRLTHLLAIFLQAKDETAGTDCTEGKLSGVVQILYGEDPPEELQRLLKPYHI